MTLNKPTAYTPTHEELKWHLKIHVTAMEKLLGSDPDLVSAYHLCDKYLKVVLDKYEVEKAAQRQQSQHTDNDPSAVERPEER